MTALSGALIIGVELTLTHWFYLYIPWFLPFALLAFVPEWGRRLRKQSGGAQAIAGIEQTGLVPRAKGDGDSERHGPSGDGGCLDQPPFIAVERSDRFRYGVGQQWLLC